MGEKAGQFTVNSKLLVVVHFPTMPDEEAAGEQGIDERVRSVVVVPIGWHIC